MPATFDHLPFPIAHAWTTVGQQTSAGARERALYATLDVTLRTLAALALADYLTGPASAEVDARWYDMAKPSSGIWLQAVQSMVSHVHNRGDATFFAEFAEWLGGAGREPARLAVELRNRWAHAHAEQLAPGHDEARQLRAEGAVCQLLDGLGWLQYYRWFRLIDGENDRSGLHYGQIQPFDSVKGLGAVTDWRWSARLCRDQVYVVSPDGQQVLDLSPGVVVMRDVEGRKDRLYVLQDFDGSQVRYPHPKTERLTHNLAVDGARSAHDALNVWRCQRYRQQRNTTPLWPMGTSQAPPLRPGPTGVAPQQPAAVPHRHQWRAATMPLQRLTGHVERCACGLWQWVRDGAPALLYSPDRQERRALPPGQRRKLVLHPGVKQKQRELVQVPHVVPNTSGQPELVLAQPIEGPWLALALHGPDLGWRGERVEALMVEPGQSYQFKSIEFMLV